MTAIVIFYNYLVKLNASKKEKRKNQRLSFSRIKDWAPRMPSLPLKKKIFWPAKWNRLVSPIHTKMTK